MKRNFFITATVLYTLFSAIFFINSEHQYKITRDNLVETKLNSVYQRIKSRLNNSIESSIQAATLLSENTSFINSLNNNKSSELKGYLSSFYSSLLKSHSTFIAIVNDSDSILYSEGLSSSEHYLKVIPVKGYENGYVNSYSVDSSGPSIYIKKNLETSGAAGSLIIGQKLSDIISDLIKDSPESFIFFSQLYAKGSVLGNQSQVLSNSDFQIIGYQSSEANSKLLENLHSISISKEKGFSLNNKHYIIGDFFELIEPNNEPVLNNYFAVDITKEKNDYIKSVAKTLFFLIILFLVIALIIIIFYSRILNSLIRFEQKLEESLNDRVKEIIDSNQELHQVFNATANGIRIIDSDFNISRVNESFCRLSGIPDVHLNGKKCYDVFPSTYCHTDNCPLERIKSGEPIIEQRDIRFKASGNKIICEYRARPFAGNNGEFLGIIEDFKDITDLETAEEGIMQTKMQFEALMNSMPVGVFIRDFEGNMIYQNTYMDKAFGPFNFERKNIKHVFPTSQVVKFLEEDKYVEKYGAFIVEEQLTDSNGVERTYVTHKFKFNGANNTAFIGGVSIDISKRKRAEHNYYVLSKAIKNTPIGVLITSPEGVIEFVNPEFEKISQRSNEDLLGRTFPPFFDIEKSPLKKSIEEALLGKVFQEEMSIVLFNNSPNWYSVSAAPVFNRNGSVAHVIFVFDDINQRKEFEKEMMISKKKAEESDRLKSAFLSNLSHEIRTPLNAILGFSSLLNNSTISADEKLDIPNQLLHHSNLLLDIINDLIDISAIETNQLVIKKGECQLNKLLVNTFNEFLKENGKKNLKTYIKLGVAEESFTILTDGERLSQVVRHLLSNAIKFTNNGFVEFGYTFKDPGTLMFYVVDSGLGLDSQEKEFIFSAFRQADDSKTRSYNGLGLGLAIAKNIIERLGGKIWVNSTKNQGSTFFFTLPYIPVRAKFEEIDQTQTKEAEFNWSNKTIMVADDIDSNFKFIQTLIKPTGANLIWAKNGKEAISMAKDNDIDLILMDIVMPEMDGFEATKQIKMIKKDIKVICQTAYPSPEHKAAGIECGMDRFLAKPIALKSMLEVINSYISQN